MKVFREKPGIISPKRCWVAIDGPWLYAADSLLALLWQVCTEWHSDKHLVG